MRSTRWWLVGLLVVAACSSKNGQMPGGAQCSDGKDNDGDGMIDFPDDPGCVSPMDDSEDSPPSPQCADGRDNDNDGKTDFPNDPGCFAPNQDDETDDCPNGPMCPQCANGIDDDGNGLIDFPNDPGCTSASDVDEYTDSPTACGPDVHIKQLPFNDMPTGMLAANAGSALMGSCGGSGIEDVYELRLTEAKVVVASTDNPGTTIDTVMYIRSADCTNATMEVACNDNVSATDTKSTLTESLLPGTYYLVVDTHDTSQSGNYALTVKFFAGEGTTCQAPADCGPGLVCRIPVGGTMMVCSKHVCSDGVDDDGDGKADYPDDPGCDSPTDDDETDDCPNGANCPECGNGRDDDGDGKIDYPMDPQCLAASSASEACMTHEQVPLITAPQTMGDTTGATSDFDVTCAFDTGVPDLTYRLDLPAVDSLSITANATTWSPDVALLGATCSGTELACGSTSITKAAMAAGSYYVVVDGDFSGEAGPFTLDVSGTIHAGASCEGVLAQSGALTCATGYSCSGTMGSRTCRATQCNDGVDNDGDGKKDYPQDPGCDSPDDNTETVPATMPQCSNGTDDDGDTKIDFANDLSCWAASGTTEAFCNSETDRAQLIFAPTQTGTTAGAHGNYAPTCQTTTSLDLAFSLVLPVPVATLSIDLIGSSFDTVLAVTTSNCATASELACNDDFSGLQSGVTLTSVAAGTYAVIVDGYSGANGAFTLHTHGVVAAGTACGSRLFTSGVLTCPAGTTCTGSPLKCQ